MGWIKEYFKISVKNLRTRPVRSWLTMIGVVIGVFLIISLLSLSEGLKEAIMSQLKMMGKDLVMIFPGGITNFAVTFGGDLELTNDDIKAVEKTEGVAFVVPMNYRAEVMRYGGEKKTVLIAGESWKDALDILKTDMGWSLSQGRWPISGKREVIVGSLVPQDIFPGMQINQEAVIKGKQFTIVGILQSVGSKQDDTMVHMDLDVFRDVTGERKGAKFAFAKIKPDYAPDSVIEKIKDSLQESRKRKRGEDMPSFSVLSSEKITSIVGNVMGVIQAAIFSLASIAIIVGGIGIMNTMYTSVHERKREIGIMKAVGAKNKTITTIFLIESGILGLVGGIGGTALGLGLAKLVEIYLQVYPLFYLRASITPGLIIFGLVFSFLVGCISGFLPARSTTRLKPVDALRYE